MRLVVGTPDLYLGADDVVESADPGVVALAAELRLSHPDDVGYARAAYEWVRDTVVHSVDADDPRVTVSASDVLHDGVGLCFAKSHLLVALLRAQGVPAGLCYQRLYDDSTDGHMLHGLVAVHLDGGWHRLDPRGNKPGVDAQFSLGAERLAWTADPAQGEVDYPAVYATPAATVIDALRGSDDALALCASGLPSDLG